MGSTSPIVGRTRIRFLLSHAAVRGSSPRRPRARERAAMCPARPPGPPRHDHVPHRPAASVPPVRALLARHGGGPPVQLLPALLRPDTAFGGGPAVTPAAPADVARCRCCGKVGKSGSYPDLDRILTDGWGLTWCDACYAARVRADLAAYEAALAMGYF